MSGKPPALPLYAKDFRVDTEHLTHEEVGIYIRLLTKMWVGAPGVPHGYLPAETGRILAILGHKSRKNSAIIRALQNVLELLETTDSDPPMLYSRRLLEELNRLQSLREIKAAAGRMGGRPRKHMLSPEKAPALQEESFAVAIASASKLSTGSASSAASELSTAASRGALADARATSWPARAQPSQAPCSPQNGHHPTHRPCKCGCGASLANRPGNAKWATPQCKARHDKAAAAADDLHVGEKAHKVVKFYNWLTGRQATAEAQDEPVRKLLRAGVNDSTLALAILGACLDPFHLGQNDRNRPYLDLATVLRRDRYEGHADKARTATWRTVPESVFAHWGERWGCGSRAARERMYKTRDRLLEREGGIPLGAAAAWGNLQPGDPWPTVEEQ